MPYKLGDSNLPSNVKTMDEKDQEKWIEVWNSAYESCIDDSGESDDCESSAFAQANGVIKSERGGQGSGNFGHGGRPGEKGGSTEGGGGASALGSGASINSEGTSVSWKNNESIRGDIIIETGDDFDANSATEEQVSAYIKASAGELDVPFIEQSEDIDEIEIKSMTTGSGTISVKVDVLPSEEAASAWEEANKYSEAYYGSVEDKRKPKDMQLGVIKKQEGQRMAKETLGLEFTVNEQTLVEKFIAAFMESLEVVRGVLTGIGRRVKDVSGWDGSASNYSSTPDYCNACLINVNPQAGKTNRDEWAQDHCMLPVREPGDNASTYVRQAIHSAAGGYGISRVKRPDDVPEDAWGRAVKAAANELIEAYGQMDEQAPNGVYKAAGKEPPEGRAVSIQTIYSQALSGLELAGIYPMDLYEDEGTLFAIGTKEGRLYKVPIIILETGDVGLGEVEQVTVDFPASAGRGLSITRQADGRYRLSGIACTAILNRSGEIDTRALFDDFITRFDSGEPAQIDLLHIEGTDVGQVDFLARDGYGLLYSALLDDGPVGEAIAKGVEAEPEFWGNSILYKPLSRELVSVGGVEIPAFTNGVLRKITILPEQEAAALFTTMEVERMNDRIKAALQKLLGNELADEMEARVDGVNRRVEDDALIARTDEPPVQVEPVQDVQPVQDAQPGLAPMTMTETGAVTEMRRNLDELTAQMASVVETIKALAETMETRLAALERTDEERKRAWLNDLPEKKRTPAAPIWRPREAQETTGDEPEPANKKAERIMQSKKGGK